MSKRICIELVCVCALRNEFALFHLAARHQLRGSERTSERLLQSISAQLTHSRCTRTDRNICVRRAYYLFLALEATKRDAPQNVASGVHMD